MADAEGIAEGNVMEDPFGEFLAQDQGEQLAAPAPAADDPSAYLRALAESAQRQEQLLGKVCSLLLGLDEKLSRVASNQEALASSLTQVAEQAASKGPSELSSKIGTGRGSIVAPPGKSPLSAPGPAAAAAPTPGISREEQARLEAEKIAAERARVEEENRRRAEELARKREEAEKRAREEAERQRIEEEKRREEERQRKQLLEKKTTGLMSDLIGGGGGGGLFGDDPAPSKKKAGGLFDD
mmetsp:Transcript_90517/g.156959  ORF Transcript_90517/g.156959 Transcript_90517/m.156959 type:complete len:241 (+) Transcript_90517:107-829(+)